METTPASPHLSAEAIAVLVDGRRVAVGHEQALEHLSVCAECRAELYALRQALGSFARRGRSKVRWALGAGVAAAAAIVLSVAIPRGTPDGPSVERALPSLALPPLSVHEPATDQPRREQLRFVWGSAGEGSRYQVTLADSLGRQLWRGETTDTIVVPPATLILPAGASLFWYVDALRSDGRTQTTRAVPLRLQP